MVNHRVFMFVTISKEVKWQQFTLLMCLSEFNGELTFVKIRCIRLAE